MLLRAARFAPARRATSLAARTAQLPPCAAPPPAYAQRNAWSAATLALRTAGSAARRVRHLCTAAPAAAAAAGQLNAKQRKEMRAHAQRLGQARKLIIVQVRSPPRRSTAAAAAAAAAKPYDFACRLARTGLRLGWRWRWTRR